MKTNIIRAALHTPTGDGNWGLPVILWGLPGVAKTAIIRELAAEYGLACETVSPACRGEGAFGVTPVPECSRMTYPRPDWTDKFEKAGRGVVFVDEINLAAPHYAGALLGLLQDKVLGSYRLPGGVRLLGAANPPAIAAASGGWDLSAPAANRVGHLDWPCPSVTEWTDWLLSADEGEKEVSDASAEEEQVMAGWPATWGWARGIVAGFLSAHSTHLHVMPTDGGGELGRAWPSPRSWHMAALALASSSTYALTESERDEFVSAFVGSGSAGEFFTWLAKASLPNSAMLLDGLVKWEHRPSRLDVTMAVFSSAVGVCLATPDLALKKKRSEAMWGLLAQAVETSPDVTVSPAKLLAHAGLMTRGVKVLSKLGGVLEAAGIDASAGKEVAA